MNKKNPERSDEAHSFRSSIDLVTRCQFVFKRGFLFFVFFFCAISLLPFLDLEGFCLIGLLLDSFIVILHKKLGPCQHSYDLEKG